jgi:hypothetical protein
MSPDGTQLVVRQETDEPRFDLFLLHLNSPVSGEKAGQLAIVQPMQTPFAKDNGVISPDGRWLAYDSSVSGHYQVFVAPFPEMNRHWQVSTAGGRSPLWAPNGRELFYLDQDGGFLTSVPVDTSGDFSYGKPARLLDKRYYAVQIRTYDVSRDGQRFLLIKDAETVDHQTVASPGVTVVQNWFDELKRRVP